MMTTPRIMLSRSKTVNTVNTTRVVLFLRFFIRPSFFKIGDRPECWTIALGSVSRGRGGVSVDNAFIIAQTAMCPTAGQFWPHVDTYTCHRQGQNCSPATKK